MVWGVTMDLNDCLIRSLAAIDSSRNKRQATVLLNYRCRKLLAQATFSRKQNHRSRVAIRQGCATLVSTSFTVMARTGDILERWGPAVQLTTDIDSRPLQRREAEIESRISASVAA